MLGALFSSSPSYGARHGFVGLCTALGRRVAVGTDLASPLFCRAPVSVQRRFGYDDTMAAKMYGPKPLVMVVHPVFKHKPRQEILWDAEEALGLARAVKWDVPPGPNEPRGGWDEEELGKVEYLQELKQAGQINLPGDWHLDRGNESDEEFDLDDPTWTSSTLRQQWAESCLVPVRNIQSSTLFPKGKCEELAMVYAQQPAHFVFVNCSLTPSQQRNLEAIFHNALQVWRKQMWEATRGEFLRFASHEEQQDAADRVAEQRGRVPLQVEVVDRQRIVLEIFAQRAQSRQAKLQVALAKANFLRTRLAANTDARLRHLLLFLHNTLGTGGSPQLQQWASASSNQFHFGGEDFREWDRRMIDEGMKRIRDELAETKKVRHLHRDHRQGTGTIALVGYTNAGKTALMNRLTGSDLKVRDLLFQTLDTTFRQAKLPSGGTAVLVDSVGFIQDLPHNLYEAFQATLEELLEADVLLHVRDISHPQSEMQKQTVIDTLHDAGLSLERIENCMIEVWNKIDLLDQERLEQLHEEMPPNAVPISALDGTGCDNLLRVTERLLHANASRREVTLEFPVREAKQRLDFLHRSSNVFVMNESIGSSEDGNTMTVRVVADRDQLARYEAKFGEGAKSAKRLGSGTTTTG